VFLPCILDKSNKITVLLAAFYRDFPVALVIARPLTALSPLKSTAWNSAQNLQNGGYHHDTPRGAKLAAL
jgi:hypothetical protein